MEIGVVELLKVWEPSMAVRSQARMFPEGVETRRAQLNPPSGGMVEE